MAFQHTWFDEPSCLFLTFHGHRLAMLNLALEREDANRKQIPQTADQVWLVFERQVSAFPVTLTLDLCPPASDR